MVVVVEAVMVVNCDGGESDYGDSGGGGSSSTYYLAVV